MDDERFNQGENAEQASEKKPEIVWEETGQGIYKETVHENRGEYHQPFNSNTQNDYWQENSRQMGQQMYQPVSKGFGIASLVLGIISLVLYCTCINLLLAVLAIIFGILQLVQKDSPKGMAIAGIVTACLSIVFFVIGIIAFVNSTDFQEEVNRRIENGLQGDFDVEVPFDEYYNDNYRDYNDYDDYRDEDFFDYDDNDSNNTF